MTFERTTGFSSIFALSAAGAVLNAVTPALREQYGAGEKLLITTPDLGVSKVVVACVLIGVWQVVRQPSGPLHLPQILCLLPALVGTLAVSGTFAWSGLALSSLLLLIALPQNKVTNGGLWIILIGSLHAPVASLLGQFAGGAILGLDRIAAVTVLSFFGSTIALPGNAIKMVDGDTLLLIWECGVFKNISLVLLLWLTTLRVLLEPEQRLCLSDALALVAYCILANTVRITLMASGGPWFEYLHDGFGAMIFRLILIAFALGMAFKELSHVRS